MKYLYSGGLQIRSEETDNFFYKIDTFSKGELALHKLYSAVRESDVPIAQDCFGDQFLIRNGKVIKLLAESGDLEEYELTWDQFLEWVAQDPIENLDLPENLELEKGKLLFAYPPFCTEQGGSASIKPIDGKELILFHADFAKQIEQVSDGQQIKIVIKE